MSVHLVVICESAVSDQLYLQKLLEHYYDVTDRTDIKIDYLPLATKTKACSISKKANLMIKAAKKVYSISAVIMVLDYDYPNLNSEQALLNQKIIGYCKAHGYHLVWMNPDIEQVLLGRKVRDSAKRSEAIAYFRSVSTDWNQVDIRLHHRICTKQKSSSNFLDILNAILK
jgi:hypothetical protein